MVEFLWRQGLLLLVLSRQVSPVEAFAGHQLSLDLDSLLRSRKSGIHLILIPGLHLSHLIFLSAHTPPPLFVILEVLQYLMLFAEHVHILVGSDILFSKLFSHFCFRVVIVKAICYWQLLCFQERSCVSLLLHNF